MRQFNLMTISPLFQVMCELMECRLVKNLLFPFRKSMLAPRLKPMNPVLLGLNLKRR